MRLLKTSAPRWLNYQLLHTYMRTKDNEEYVILKQKTKQTKITKNKEKTTYKPDEYVSIPKSRICLSSGIIIILPTMSKTIYIYHL